jgi:hypothetical protein
MITEEKQDIGKDGIEQKNLKHLLGNVRYAQDLYLKLVKEKMQINIVVIPAWS